MEKIEEKEAIRENLGAKFVKNKKGKWEAVVTKKQDYETPAMRSYTLIISIGQEKLKIKIAVVNIDDNPPVIQANERNCFVEV